MAKINCKTKDKEKTIEKTIEKTTEPRSDLPVSAKLLAEVARTLENASAWSLFSHMKLDGDALGTATALFEAGVLQGKTIRWIGPDPVPPSYRFLPHVEEYVTQKEYRFDEKDRLYVFLDSANEDRGTRGLRDRSPSTFILNIDHHEDNSRFGTLNCVEPKASSTSELLWHVMKAGGWTITPHIAECLYTGIVADTGNFVFSNTTSTTHQVTADLLRRGVDPARIDAFLRQTRSLEGMHLWGVALGRICRWGEKNQFAMSWLTQEDFRLTKANASDTEMLVSQLLLIRDVRFAVLLTEEEREVKASFRSRAESVAASTVARALGGGGHPRASGAQLPPPLDQAIRSVRETVEAAYAEWASSGR
ncbi:MAG: DHH family phosphoesterase [Synergistaceae bacterium]|jgi:phosphoesterase RecJ-like protein|nr:DHH family phosphoesterase [Synergistaceae bacterium]